MASAYPDDESWARRLRRAGEQMGVSAAEAAALALLAAGAIAALGLLWVIGRPEPAPVAGADDAGRGNAVAADDAAGGVAVTADDLVVAVTGHVASPGLYELAGGARVADALDAAGGPLPGAAVETLNLARPLSDGEQLLVPGPAPPGGDGHPGAEGGTPPAEPALPARRPDGTLDLNLATAADLEELPGIGPVLAERIVAHREANGPFTATDDLRAVSGIGDKKFAAVADLVSVG